MCVFFCFVFGYLHPARQQLRARVAPLAHGYRGARRHGADTPNQHLPHYLHYLHARRAGAMPRSPVVLSWMSPCWVTALSPCCGDSRSGPARRQSSEHCSQDSSRARSQPRSRAGSFLLCCTSRQPQELPWHRPGARPPHLHPVRSCVSKAAPVRAPQPQELVWEEGARREIPHPKCRIWLASVQPSATTQSLHAGPPNPKGELISKPPATAQPPFSSHHLCPHQPCSWTPQNKQGWAVRAPRAISLHTHPAAEV